MLRRNIYALWALRRNPPGVDSRARLLFQQVGASETADLSVRYVESESLAGFPADGLGSGERLPAPVVEILS